MDTLALFNWHCQRVNAELSNSRIVSKNLHILGTRFGPLNVGNRRRWLPDGRQIRSFIGRWPCNLVRESWEISKDTKSEKNPPENGCQVLDRFCFVHGPCLICRWLGVLGSYDSFTSAESCCYNKTFLFQAWSINWPMNQSSHPMHPAFAFH
jgi:hypothetical protein